jgi:ERCC4-type nuclease
MNSHIRSASIGPLAGSLRIVADDRENAAGVLQELGARGEIELAIERLEVGDYLVGSQIVVERKTIPDFARSIVDTRLFRQAGAMAAGPRRAVLILEGNSAAIVEHGVTREAFQGALITVSVFYGVPILRASEPTETARLLVYLGRQAEHIASGAWHRPGYRPKGRRGRQLFILQGLPGVGPRRAASLLERFGSVSAVANALPVDLAGVDGIGANTAAKIRWARDAEPAEGNGSNQRPS